MVIVEVPFFVRFEDFEKGIKEFFGENYRVINLLKSGDGKWQVVIDKIYSPNKDTYLPKLPEMTWFNPVVVDRQRN